MAGLVDVPCARHAHGEHEREGARFPLRCQTGSSASGITGPKPVKPPMSCGPFMQGLRQPVPIIESRVTSSASCSSLSLPFPGPLGDHEIADLGGRIPHADLLVLGMSTPNSFSTSRGSITARER
jgi:hypothetical protein